MAKWNLKRIPMRYILLAVCLLTLLSTSALLAKYVTNSGEAKNQFSKVQVSCEAAEVPVYTAGKLTGKSSITVKNTSTVDVYIRVRLVSYWQTPSGHIAGITSVTPKLHTASLLNEDDWLYDEDNDTYYYKNRLDVNGITDNLLVKDLVLTKPEEKDGYIHVVKVLAEAIQADGMTDATPGVPAVVDAWDVTLGDDGKIVSVATPPATP